MKKIAIIVWSLRKESWSKKLAQEIVKMSSNKIDMKIIEIWKLEFYNEDLEINLPKSWEDFRNNMKEMDGFLFITPEYNRSIPWVIKNAIDVWSRPYWQSIWTSKPWAVISLTMWWLWGFWANHILRQSMVFLDVYMMQQPEIYLSEIQNSFDENWNLTERTQKYIQNFLDSFENWINKF